MRDPLTWAFNAPYRAGRSTHWLKCRCAVVETVAVVGFTALGRTAGDA